MKDMIPIKDMMDETTREKICRLIAGIVVVDDELDETEDKFIDKLLMEFGFAPEQRDALFPIMDATEAAAELCGLPPEIQHTAMDLLIFAAASDGKYVAEEQVYLQTVGNAIGWDSAKVEERIAELIEDKI